MPVKFQPGVKSSSKRCSVSARPDHLHRHRFSLRIASWNCAVGHLARPDQLLVQRAELQAAEHVGRLVERAVVAGERAPHLGRGVRRARGRRGRPGSRCTPAASSCRGGSCSEKMIRAQRCMRQKSMPTRSSGDLREASGPTAASPSRAPSLRPRTACRTAPRCGVVARRHEALQVMAGDQLVEDGGAREVRCCCRACSSASPRGSSCRSGTRR